MSDSTMSELAASQKLRFVVEAVDDLSAGLVANSYQIRQIDHTGNTVLSLIVPSATLEPAVLERAELCISLSPAGEVSIVCDSVAAADLPRATTNIEDLIKQSVTLQMLEDEADVEAMLQTLRKRLIASLAAVDEAISNLEPKSTP